MNDPLDTPVDRVPTPVGVSLPVDHEPDIFFDGERFYKHLKRSYNFFDVMTYSNAKTKTPPLRRVRRLITNLPPGATRAEEVRLVCNNHIKLFLCYTNDGILVAAYVGSLNLTYATQLNLMCQITSQRHLAALHSFFDTVWAAAHQKHNRLQI